MHAYVIYTQMYFTRHYHSFNIYSYSESDLLRRYQMHSDNIVSFIHGITFIYPTQTASLKFTLHHNFVKHHACALYTARLFILLFQEK